MGFRLNTAGRVAMFLFSAFLSHPMVQAPRVFPFGPPGPRITSTPLHYAILQGNSEIAEVLMKAGADASEADIDGMSPLSFAETALGLLKSDEME